MIIKEDSNNIILILDDNELECYNIVKELHGTVFFKDYIGKFLNGRREQLKANLSDKLASICELKDLRNMVEVESKKMNFNLNSQVDVQSEEIKNG